MTPNCRTTTSQVDVYKRQGRRRAAGIQGSAVAQVGRQDTHHLPIVVGIAGPRDALEGRDCPQLHRGILNAELLDGLRYCLLYTSGKVDRHSTEVDITELDFGEFRVDPTTPLKPRLASELRLP